MAEDSKTIARFKSVHLQPEEQIIASGVGYIGELMGKGKNKAYNGLLIVTNTRVCFLHKTLFTEVFETIPIKVITSIERKSVMACSVIKLHTSNDSLEFKSLQKDVIPLLANAIETARALTVTAEAAISSSSSVTLDAIARLGDLKASGVLTEAEFATKKAELLSRL